MKTNLRDKMKGPEGKSKGQRGKKSHSFKDSISPEHKLTFTRVCFHGSKSSEADSGWICSSPSFPYSS